MAKERRHEGKHAQAKSNRLLPATDMGMRTLVCAHKEAANMIKERLGDSEC